MELPTLTNMELKMSDANCISCGMPIRSADEAAAGDINKGFCQHCSNEDGTLKSYDDVLAGMTQFMIRTQGIDDSVAKKMAAEMMRKLPAWSDR